MKRKKLSWCRCGVLLCCAWSADAELAVIVNPGNPVASVSRAELKKMLLGAQKKWPGGGQSVAVVTQPAGDPERKAALQEFCGMTEQQYAAALLQANFTGDDRSAPKALPSDAVIVQVVGLTPGGIAVVDAAKVTAKVKRVTVEK